MTIHEPNELWPKLDKLGVDQVRQKIAMGVFSKSKIPLIEEWLRIKSEEKEAVTHSINPSASETLYDRTFAYFKNHKYFSILLFFSLAIIGLGALTEAIDKIINFSDKYIEQEEVKVSVPKSGTSIINKLPEISTNNEVFYSNLNRDYKKRDKILGMNVKWDKKTLGTYRIEQVNLDTLNLLVSNNFIDLEERQNESPSVKEFMQFLEKQPSFRAHGYAVGPKRNDYRVTLEGILIKEKFITKDLKIAFYEFCKEADEIITKGDLWCWWD